MPETISLSPPVVLGREQILTPDKSPRSQLTDGHTVIRTDVLRRPYKLARAYSKVRNLEFRSDRKFKLQTYQDYLAQQPLARAVRIDKKTRPAYGQDEAYRNAFSRIQFPLGRMAVLVHHSLYDALKDSIKQYILDVGREGYWATAYTVEGARPVDIRDFLRNERPVGALLVGAIAAPWYQLGGDQFPCDLYYMDLDGTWQESGTPGLFVGHSGDADPELWVSRLYTPTAGGNDPELLKDYFWRNHEFRLGRLGHARSALAYVDDDWQGFEDCAMDEMFPADLVTYYNAPAQTDADLYKAEVQTLRSWVHICAHSWVQGHALRVDSQNEWIHVEDFRDKNPPNAHFYNLFACGPGRYTDAEYLAGWYIFDKSGGGRNHGLTAVASAKSGSMLFFEDFYRPLGQGRVIGDAYREWWQAQGPVYEEWEQSWYYGLTLLGDPTLNWWKGATPAVEQPQKEDVFDHYPRKMQLRWDPVNVPGATYTVEVDAFGATNPNQWAEATQQSFLYWHGLSVHTLEHEFVGAQRGRWRVRADVGGTACHWSPWSYFRFTI